MAVNKPKRKVLLQKKRKSVLIERRTVNEEPSSILCMPILCMSGKARLRESPDVLFRQLSPISSNRDLLLDLQLSDSEDDDMADSVVQQLSAIRSNQQLLLDLQLSDSEDSDIGDISF